MSNLAQADIFFFISGVGFLIVFALVVTALFYVIGVLRDVRGISKKVREESDNIIAEARAFRGSLKDAGNKMLAFFFKPFVRKSSRRKKKEESDSQ